MKPSVSPVIRPLHAAVAGLLLWARWAGDVDRLLHGCRSAANDYIIPQTFTVTSNISAFTFKFFCFTVFSCHLRAVD